MAGYRFDKEDLKRQCEALSNEELFVVVNNKMKYTEQIVTAAQIELSKRAVPKEERKKHNRKARNLSKNLNRDISTEISLLEKIMFYVICIPVINRWVLWDYGRKGYSLKVRQGSYYTIAGLGLLLLFIFLGSKGLGLATGGGCWLLAFIPVYFLEKYYFKAKLIKWLSPKTTEEEEDLNQ